MDHLVDHESLATLFHICSHKGMTGLDEQHIAELILAAPGWARLGITESKPELRAAAAGELARAILAQAAPTPSPSLSGHAATRL